MGRGPRLGSTEGPEVGSPIFHGIHSNKANQAPDMGGDSRVGGAEEEEGGGSEWVWGDGLLKLLSYSNSHRAVPKGMAPGGAGVRRGAWAEPGAYVTTRDSIDSETPEGFLEAVVTWEAPSKAEGSGEMGKGNGHSGGGGDKADVGNVV